MQIHANATTNHKQRQAIRHSSESCGQLAQRYHVSKATIHAWKHRDNFTDHSSRPHTSDTALSKEEEQFILALRGHDYSLDDTFDVAHSLLPHVCRSNVYRTFKRYGVNRREQPKREAGTFKEYPPGFLHIDCFYLPQLEGKKRYCFLAVDRATRLIFLEVYEHKDAKSATDFLKKCLNFFPFVIEKILTDNGREFTLEGFRNRYGPAKKAHPFDLLCQEQGIEHRRTKPYTPQTNGLAERMNGLTKENTTKKNAYAGPQEMIEDLKGWMVRYDFYRPHRQLGRKTPYEAVCEWHKKEPQRFLREPSSLLAYRSYRSQPPET
ncbi:MAG: IS481 family transposase [Armatimonadetes bacterium]|nr:IS481 family transposase [Armatimonadota bacterium]